MPRLIFLVILVLIACLQGFASEIYAPSLMSIGQHFKVDANTAQGSIAIYLLASSVFQLVYGPLSDHWGRKLCLAIGLIVFLIGCYAAVCAVSIKELNIARFIQGAGVAAPATLWRALFRDQFDGDDLVRYGGYLGTIMVVVIPIAPLLGGWLEIHYGWQSSFYALGLYAFLLLACIIFLLNSDVCKKNNNGLASTFEGLRRILANRSFCVYSCCSALVYAAFMGWFTAAPVIYIGRLGLDADHFGQIACITTAICMFMGSLSVAKLVGRFGALRMLRMGLLISSIFALCLLYVEFEGFVSVISLVAVAFLYFYGSGFVWPAAFGGAMKPFSEHAGLAGALYGTIQVFGGYCGAQMVAYLHDADLYGLGILMLVTPVSALVLSYTLKEQQSL